MATSEQRLRRPGQDEKVKIDTLVVLVLDETGSMQPITSDTIGSVNDYFETLAKETPDALCSLMLFSDNFGHEPNFRPLAEAVKATEVPRLDTTNYRPRGNTPLYDAIGKAITDTETVEAERYLLVVMTDGQENCSTEWTLIGVRKLIEKKQGENWTIVYLGANQDAWTVGGSMGVAPGNTMSFQTGRTGQGMVNSTQSLARATSGYVAGASGPEGPTGPAGATEDFFKDAGQTEADYKAPEDDN